MMHQSSRGWHVIGSGGRSQKRVYTVTHWLLSALWRAWKPSSAAWKSINHHPLTFTHTTVPAKVSVQERPRHLPQSSRQCFPSLWWWGVLRKPRKAVSPSLLVFLWCCSTRPTSPSAPPLQTRSPSLNHRWSRRNRTAGWCWCRRSSPPAGSRWNCDFFQDCDAMSEELTRLCCQRWRWRWRAWSPHDHSWMVLMRKIKAKQKQIL